MTACTSKGRVPVPVLLDDEPHRGQRESMSNDWHDWNDSNDSNGPRVPVLGAISVMFLLALRVVRWLIVGRVGCVVEKWKGKYLRENSCGRDGKV